MAYKYSLMDDDDELSASLLSDPGYTLSNRDPVTERAKSLASKPTGVWTPTVQRDPAMADRWKQQEATALDRANYDPRDYGIGEGVRDYGGLALVGILDALANGGKGLPTLAAQTLSINDASEQRRRQEAKDAGEFAIRARGQQNSDLENQLRIKQIQQQDERIALAGQGEGRRSGAYDRAMNPDNPALTAQKAELMRLSGGRITEENLKGLDADAVKGLAHGYNLQLDSANTPQKAADEASVASSKTNAEERVRLGYIAPKEVQKGIGEAAAEPYKRPELAKTAAATSQAREVGAGQGARDVALSKTPALAEVEDANRYGSLTPAELQKANDAGTAKAVFDNQMNILKQIRQEVGGASIMPSGAKAKYDAAAKIAIGQLPSLTGTGVINEGERKDFERMIIQSGVTLGDIVNLGGQGDVVLDQLSGTQDAIGSAYTTKLKGYGLRPKGSDPAVQPSYSQTPGAPASDRGTYTAIVDGEEITFTGSKSAFTKKYPQSVFQ